MMIRNSDISGRINMDTMILPVGEEGVETAAALLSRGEIVAIPTETVYGLAANALDPVAVNRIFEAKGRPRDNPLILHICDMDMLDTIACDIPPLAVTLSSAFWPGPLTMIFKKKDIVPPETNGGMDTVAARMPENRWTLELIRRCNFPLAAPSANISGLPSPTTAMHVKKDMDGKIPLILDGGSCRCGVESTVVCFHGEGVKILRPGGVTPEMLEKYCPVEIDRTVTQDLETGEKPISPGTKYKHYSPKAEVYIVETDSDKKFTDYINSLSGDNIYVLARNNDGINKKTLPYGQTSETEAAALFDSLRMADEFGAESVYVRCPDKNGIGLAVYNRLLRAAAFKVIKIE